MGGSAYLGYRWRDAPSKQDKDYDYVARGVQPEAWQHYTGLAIPPPETAGVRVWLLNYESEGKVYFDDVALVPLPLPEAN